MTETSVPEFSDHAIVAGYGVPGRAVVDWMRDHEMPCVVIEQNHQIVERCEATATHIIQGDARDESVLRRAGIERAKIFAVAVPVEAVVLEAVSIARRLNPTVKIIARCNFISGGLEAVRRGADETIVAEETAAREFSRLLEGGHATIRAVHSVGHLAHPDTPAK